MTRQTTPDVRLIAAMVEACAAACVACAEECELHAAHDEHRRAWKKFCPWSK